MKYYAIIVAGGTGSRMGSDIPKQFLLLNSRPLLMHTIDAFYFSDLKPEIIVALNINYHQYWAGLCAQHNFNIPHKLVEGGNERFSSVKNSLEEIKENSIIAVHDAVRPNISNELITRAFGEAEKQGTAIAAIVSTDSVRQIRNDTSQSLDRKTIFLIQTPQTFQSQILKKAYEQPYHAEFTDDASVVEKIGVKINIIAGESCNLKITYPEDIEIVKALISHKKNPVK